MELGFAGKRVVDTRGIKGIWKAIALALAKEGANLSICAGVKQISLPLKRN